MKPFRTQVLYAFCCFGIAFSPAASAQICQATNSSLNSAYGYVANQSEFGTTTSSATGTSSTGTTGTTTATGSTTSSTGFSNSTLGELLGGIASASPFNLAGRLVFDGAGNIDAGSPTALGATNKVGTYNVNSDCSVTVTLSDASGTNTTATTLIGVVLGGGAEIDLTSLATNQSASSSGSSSPGTSSGGTSGATGTPTTSASSTQFGSGLAIKLIRILSPYGCSVSNLTGLYGFVLTGAAAPTASLASTGTGVGTTSGSGTGTSSGTGTGTTSGSGTGTTSGSGTGTTSSSGSGTGTSGTGTGTSSSSSGALQPFTLIGHLDFDGNGKVITNPLTASITTIAGSLVAGSATTASAVQASLANLQYTGTYTVSPDCSGTLTLSNLSTASSNTGGNGTNSGTTTGSTTGTATGTTTGTTTGSTTGTTNGSTTGTATGTTTGSTTGTPTSNNSNTTAGESFTATFVITQPRVTVAPGTNLNQYTLAPSLALTVSGPDGTASGYALPE